MKNVFKNKRAGERGNVLFLILIAVALFAALSYAVTQSTRSGGGDASSETNLINSAQLTQYPAGVRTSVVRMLIGGVALDQLYFNGPSEFGTGQLIDTLDEERRAVFHPTGGGAVFAQAPQDVLSGGDRQWVFSADFEINRIGTSSAGSAAGNDLIAFLPNVTFNMCKKLNEEVGIALDGGAIPLGATTMVVPSVATHGLVHGKTPPIAVTEAGIIGGAGGTFFSGQPFGCFRVGAAPGTNVYYHVLVEQ